MDNDLAVISENIMKLHKDMVNFLDYEKLENGQTFYNHETITDLSATLRNALKMFEEMSQCKGIRIHPDIEHNIRVRVDPYAADRIVNNLVNNAITYTGKAGSIEVTLKSNKTWVVLKVRDTGIGIDEEQIPHIFKPYFQISHKKRNIQGIGMGLTIVKKIIDEIDGKIEVRSMRGQGTEFTVYFNKYCGEVTGKTGTSLDQIDYPVKPVYKGHQVNTVEKTKKYSILIIEDNPEMLGYLCEVLGGYYNVFCAQNGRQALEKLPTMRNFDLVISDIMMDVMDGYEFYEAFVQKEENRAVPVIFLTAKNTQYERIKAFKKGVIDFINKPFDIEELEAKIDSLIHLSESQYEKSRRELVRQVIKSLDTKNNDDEFLLLFEKKCLKQDISKREKDIILLLLNGSQYKEIADRLFISVNTVRTHINHIYTKCGVKDKVGLINFFKES